MLSEVSQTEKYKYCISDIILTTYLDAKKNDTNELIYKTETDSQIKIKTWLPKGMGRGESRNKIN